MRRHRLVAAVVLAAALLPPAVAAAQAPPPPAPAPPAAPAGPRKDPHGVTGISPYMEAIQRGEAAYLARDFAGAVAAFQEAVKIDPRKALAFYRMGEAQLAAGNLGEAEASWMSAQRAGATEDLLARVLFVLADLRERQGKWEEAKAAWNAYASFISSRPKANGYPATPTERIRRIDTRMEMEKGYAQVKERIALRNKEQADAAAANAAKDAAKNK